MRNIKHKIHKRMLKMRIACVCMRACGLLTGVL